jgi:hypothetical protein
MWTMDEKTQTFKALPYREKLRVSRYLARGQAPEDPLRAAAAVELAESYQRQAYVAWMPWLLAISLVLAGARVVFDAIDGDQLGLALSASFGLVCILHFVFNPMTRPKNRTRALEASRRVVDS